MNIVLLGPQGSGKGTQGKMLSKHYGIPHISTGQLLRDIAATDTPLAHELRDILKSGDLVSDEILMEVLSERMERDDCKKGVLLDGVPRTKNQALLLEKTLDLDGVVFMDITDEEAIFRASNRWHCPNCQALYNLQTHAPRRKGICDLCSTKLVQREDDNPKSIHERLEHYHQETKPLVDFYREKGLLIEINGMQRLKMVYREILARLQEHQPSTQTVA